MYESIWHTNPETTIECSMFNTGYPKCQLHFMLYLTCGSEVGCGTMLQAGSSPDEVDFFSVLPNPSSCPMALWSTQPLTEMSTRNFLGGVKGGRRIGLATLLPSVSRLYRQNVGASTSHIPMGLRGLLHWYRFTLPDIHGFKWCKGIISHVPE
jgi:hypothetical protein